MSKVLVSHIGIAVKDLDAAVATYSLLTGNDSPILEEVPEQKVKVAMLADRSDPEGKDGGRVELLTPTGEDSPIAGFLNKRGEGLHHLCIYVDDIEKKLAELKAAGVRLINETPRVGAGGHRIAFVHPAGTGGVLLELEERS